MKNETHRFALLATRAVWPLLITCVCLMGGGAAGFGQGKPVSVPDETYGKGGKKITEETTTDARKTTNVEIRDKQKVKREESSTSVNIRTGKKSREAVTFYDCKGERTYNRVIEYDIFGNETRFEEDRYKDGKRFSGFERGTKPDGTKYIQRYNPKTNKYEEIAFDAGPTSDEISAPQPDTSTCPVANFQHNEIFGGFSLIREDSDPDNFNTYGLDASYTRFVTEQAGVRASFNAHFREQGGVKLSKISILGGIKILPFKQATTEDHVTIFTNALFGVSHFRAEFGPATFTDNSFTMKLGGGLDVNVNENFFVRPIQIDYAPTFFGNAMQHNVQFSFGAGFRF